MTRSLSIAYFKAHLSEVLGGVARRGDRVTINKRGRPVATLVPPEAVDEGRRSIRATLETKGIRLANPDLRVAAIAISRGATLMTGNVKHFSRVPDLKVENWLQ